MTVCIAAICMYGGSSMILGASDRMLTSGDVEFEPPTTKIYRLGLNAVILVGGDAAVQADICDKTYDQRMKDNVTDVRDVAEIYAKHFADYRRQRNERSFLHPLGLTLDTFTQRQSGMLPEEVARLSRDMKYEDLDIEAIITGVDARGAHIYVVTDPGIVDCQDSVGFAAIGIGANHAESQFMFSRYHPRETFERALYMVYSAKKRAEVAPGVGLAEDLFSVTLSTYTVAEQSINERMDAIYEEVIENQEETKAGAIKAVAKLVEDLVASATAQVQPTGEGSREEKASARDEAYKEGV